MSPPDRPFDGAHVLVTGGAGFIGSHLVEGLLAAGARRVVALDDFSLGKVANLAGTDPERVHVERGDCGDPATIDRVAKHGVFDYCFNLAVVPLPASLVRPRATVEANVSATCAICELGRAGGYRRLIQFSSSEVYGTAVTVPMAENHPMNPSTPYAASKLATDVIALSYIESFGLEVALVRPFNTFGPRQNDSAYAGLIPAVITAFTAGLPVTVHGDGLQTRDYVFVEDVVAATLALAQCDAALGRPVNVGSGREYTVNEVVASILTALERPDWPVITGPDRPGDVRRLLSDVSLARQLIDFEPAVSLADGLRTTVASYLGASSKA